jgi:hypothetical protein
MSELLPLWPATDPSATPAIVINLDRSKDRLAQFVADNQGKFAGGCWRLPAVDGQKIDPKRYATPDAFGVSQGAAGCWLSHRKALTNGINAFGRTFFVLEDDAKLLMPPPADLLDFDRDFVWLSYIKCQCGPVTTHALLWSIQGAKKALRLLSQKMPCPVDNYLCNAVNANALTCALRTENEMDWTKGSAIIRPANPWITLAEHKSTITL